MNEIAKNNPKDNLTNKSFNNKNGSKIKNNNGQKNNGKNK